jgi:hypothetical protein
MSYLLKRPVYCVCESVSPHRKGLPKARCALGLELRCAQLQKRSQGGASDWRTPQTHLVQVMAPGVVYQDMHLYLVSYGCGQENGTHIPPILGGALAFCPRPAPRAEEQHG